MNKKKVTVPPVKINSEYDFFIKNLYDSLSNLTSEMDFR